MDTRQIVYEVIAEALEKTPEEVEELADASFADDLAMTSMQYFPVIAQLEERLGVEVGFADFIDQAHTANEAVSFAEQLVAGK